MAGSFQDGSRPINPAHYLCLLPDSLDRARTALDSFLADEADEAFEH
jgi:hypothetical protein